MRAEFLKSGFHDFGQMAALILLGNADGLFNLSFSQTTGNRGSKFARLLSSLAEGDVTIDHDADGPGRHDGEQDDHGLGSDAHIAPHGS